MQWHFSSLPIFFVRHFKKLTSSNDVGHEVISVIYLTCLFSKSWVFHDNVCRCNPEVMTLRCKSHEFFSRVFKVMTFWYFCHDFDFFQKFLMSKKCVIWLVELLCQKGRRGLYFGFEDIDFQTYRCPKWALSVWKVLSLYWLID